MDIVMPMTERGRRMTMTAHLADRRTAGEELAAALERFTLDECVVVGLTRGGVAVAEPIAIALQVPLDMLVVHKMGAPDEPELALGAFAEGDVLVVDRLLCGRLGMDDGEIRDLIRAHAVAFEARIRHYRRTFPRIPLTGKVAILVDDGLATGSTAHAAVRSARRAGASAVILAVPVGAQSALDRLRPLVDEIVCLHVPDSFMSVGSHYDRFPQLDDADMFAILDRGTCSDVTVNVGDVVLRGRLDIPLGADLLVIFAHGSGSSRFSPRNAQVARVLQESGIATLLIDLLTEDEAAIRHHVFDIDRLADRLEGIVAWSRTTPRTQHLGIALFGASTGAAAALAVAARCPELIRSVVSRGGRPDLAHPWLPLVEAPTLLIVGENDVEVLRLTRDAIAQMTCPTTLEIIAGASHLFEEPGALARVADLARDWFAHVSTARAA